MKVFPVKIQISLVCLFPATENYIQLVPARHGNRACALALVFCFTTLVNYRTKEKEICLKTTHKEQKPF